ncbi:hypothetical protein ABQF35_25870 [Mycobacterium syngnathidarum]
MRYYGVVYDVGLRFDPETVSVEPFDLSLVDYDMHVIAEELGANAVRIEGESLDRLVVATRSAHAAGLAVFFNPWMWNAGVSDTLTYLAEAAIAAEELRQEGIEIVFLTTCEFSLFSDEIYPGANVLERIAWLGEQMTNKPQELAARAVKLNSALNSFADTVRASFAGPVTYCAGAWEDVDWNIFDVVGMDYYRQGETDDEYRRGLRRFAQSNRPLAVMEFGCCAYEGAARLGGGGFMVLKGINADGTGNFDGGEPPVRSESEQADYITQQLGVFATENVDAAFVFVFSAPFYRYGQGARDLDMVSYSLVKTFPLDDPRAQQMPPWEPKEAFHRVADFFHSQITS